MRLTTALPALATLAFALPALAQFSPGPNPVTGTAGAQTLSSGTGTVNSGGKISSSSTPLTMSGTSTLQNNGTIENTGTGRAVNSTAANANLTIVNAGLIQSVDDVVRVNGAGSSITLTNSGTLRATGGASPGQAIDWADLTSTNVLNNLLGGIISSVGDDAVRPGNNGVINNAGTLSATPTGTTSPSGSDGIDMRTGKTITVTNSGLIQGRHGIATDGANLQATLNLTNNAGGVIAALNGSGVNLDGANTNVVAFVLNNSGATIKGGVMATATSGDGDGIDVDGVLNLTNYGDVLGLGARGADNNAEGIAAGGGIINNYASGRIIGSSLALDAPNGDTSRGGNGILIDDSNGGNAVAATTINNYGLIEGRSGFGVKIVGNYADTLNNNAGGIIRGTGVEAAVQTGGGDDVFTHAGSVVGTGGSAIDMGAGNDRLRVVGGVASIQGNVSGGAGSNVLELLPGAGNGFAYGGSLSNFDRVEVQSGTVTLSGVNAYTGLTVVRGGVLVLDGQGRLATESALQMDGGALAIAHAAGTDGQQFARLDLTGSSVIDLGQSALVFGALGAVADGATLAITNWSAEGSPGYALRFYGDLSGDADFQALVGRTTINGGAASYLVDAGFTNVTAVPLPAAAWLLLSGLGVVGGAMRRRRVAVAA